MADETAVLVTLSDPPEWVHDAMVSKCHLCMTDFGVFVRKHHCRACGNIFCAECCSTLKNLPKHWKYTKPQRVCNTCVNQAQHHAPADTSSLSNREPPSWVADAFSQACFSCKTEFSVTNRRHHCRACGQVFCDSCSSNRRDLPRSWRYDKPQRVCNPCYRIPL